MTRGVARKRRRWVIRSVAADDLSQVIALDKKSTGLAKPDYWTDLLARYGRPGRQRYFLVAEQEGRIVGFVIGEVRAWEFGSPPCGWIFAIDVDPDERLGGVGTALYEDIADRFRKAGMSKLRTMLARDDHLIMSFFRSQGMMAGPSIQLEADLETS